MYRLRFDGPYQPARRRQWQLAASGVAGCSPTALTRQPERQREEPNRLAPFLFLDETQWALPQTSECMPIPFPSRDGVYWGLPPDDAQ